MTIFTPKSVPDEGLIRDGSGYPIDRTVIGRQQLDWLAVRNGLVGGPNIDGTIPNAEDLLDDIIVGVLNGNIDISGVTVAGIFCNVVMGSLDEVHIYPKFTDINDTVIAPLCTLSESLAGRVMTYSLLDTKFRMQASGAYYFVFPLPCAKYMKLYTASVGTITNSYLYVWVGLGWGSPFQRADV